MANVERGEVRLVVGAHTYVLRLTTWACVELEDFADLTLDEAIRRMATPGRGQHRAALWVLWAALREHHPDLATDDPKTSLKAISRIVDEADDLTALMTELQRFLKMNQAPPEDAPAPAPTPAGGESRPPDAQLEATGAASTPNVFATV